MQDVADKQALSGTKLEETGKSLAAPTGTGATGGGSVVVVVVVVVDVNGCGGMKITLTSPSIISNS